MSFSRCCVRPRIAKVAAPIQITALAKLFVDAEQVTITETISACRDPTDDNFRNWRLTVVPTLSYPATSIC
jgi:hypothetical protein